MDLGVTMVGEIMVATLTGEVDGQTAPEAQERLSAQLSPLSKLMLDMSGVTYLSSAGLRMLLAIYRQLAAVDGRIVLVGLSEEIKDTMVMTGLLRFFPLSDSVDAGLTMLI
jgi:anti-sigma B factor antagonist